MDKKKSKAVRDEPPQKELKEWETPKLVVEEVDEVTEGGIFLPGVEGNFYNS